MQIEAVGFVSGLGYVNHGSLHRLGPQLYETMLLVLFGAWVMPNEVVWPIWGLVMRNGPGGVVWACDYVKWGCFHGCACGR